MKKYLFCLALLVGGPALADPLADANAAFAKKDYPQALQLYTKLANAGNAEAQLRLGDMYLNGEAGAVDEAKAQAWLGKAAAKGNKDAVAALELMQQRAAHRADIDYWISKYDGSDLREGEYRCPTPRIPTLSKQNEEIDRVAGLIKSWQDCYNRFVEHMNAVSPLVKRIPPEVAKLMTKDEMARATTHLEQVHANVAEDARVSAKLILADYGAWRHATQAWVTEHNEIVRNTPSPEQQRALESRKNNYGQ
jgi:uncharacterized protein